MTDFSPLKTQNPLQLTPSTTLAPAAPPSLNGFSPVADRGEEEESSTIKCICGYDDDDGNTVYCEECKSWQHIECYYQSLADVPDVHECTDCKPRYLDAARAAARQEQQRVLISAKTKRAPSKGQKRRVKDPLQPNGWRGDSMDRASGSPKDQPPPAKRPKTNHKSSSSNSVNQTMSHHRRRTGSTVTGRSPAKRLPSPPYQGPYYSPQFMHLHRNPDFALVQSNSYASIAVSNDLSSWLTDPDLLKDITGKTPDEVFQRWDKPMEELESTSPGVNTAMAEDPRMTIDGLHPTFRFLTVESGAPPKAYVGELKGQIGRKQDYFQDPKNRWEELRHPEPFVFFHDMLPVYIDSRSEGTNMRYVRRSCDPNVKIQIIITSTEYHFCLVSTREIMAGEEITLGWTLDERPIEIGRIMAQRSLTEDEETYMFLWVTKLLANFGGCACARPTGACVMCRFDRRLHPHAPIQTDKTAKGKKGKKLGHQISPLSTGQATNSRAGSETVNNGDIDEEAIDTRSVSASSRSKPTSRDNTPIVGLGVEMSERDRRKLLQQEKLFEQLEYEEQHGGKKKKRNSAGSALNTPSVSTSKQLCFPDSSNPSPTGAPAAARIRINGLSHKSHKSSKSAPNSAPNSMQRVKPVYVDGSTQTEEETKDASASPLVRWRARGSFAQRLMRQAAEERDRRAQLLAERKNSLQTSSPLSSKAESVSAREAATSMPPPPLPPPSRLSRSVSPHPRAPSKADVKEDVEMKDADDQKEDVRTPTNNQPTDTAMQTTPEVPPSTSSPIQQPRPPPPPPWPASAVPIQSAELTPKPAIRAPDLHVDLPPPPAFPAPPSAQTPTTPLAAVYPGPVTPSLATPSPSVIHNAPPFSQSVIANVQQSSPAKMVKRTSLSDYMKKRAQAKASTATTSAASSSPSSEQKTATSGPPSIPTASSSTVIEEVDMPLAPPRPSSAEEKENKPDPSAAATTTTGS